MSYFQPSVHFLVLPGCDMCTQKQFVIHATQLIMAWVISCVTSVLKLFAWLIIQMGSRKRSPGAGGGGGSQKDATPWDNSLPTKAVLLFSTTRQHPNTACLITPSERKTGAVSLPWCHIWDIMWQRAINTTTGPFHWPLVQVMSGGFKAPNLQSQSTETHPLSAYSGISLGSDSYCWCQTQCQ